MTSICTATKHVQRSSVFSMESVVNYTEEFELKYGISSAEACIKGLHDDKMPTRYPPLQSYSSYIWYVRLSCLMKKNDEIFPLLEPLDGSPANGEYSGISHLDSVVLYASRVCFVVLVIEPADFYINNPTNSTTLLCFQLYSSRREDAANSVRPAR